MGTNYITVQVFLLLETLCGKITRTICIVQYFCLGNVTPQLVLLSSNPTLTFGKERSSRWQSRSEEDGSPNELHAKRGALLLIIGAVVRVFVKSQRRDTYYRNDPSKYGLEIRGKRKPVCI